jgi:NADPH:quinone reductase-like Zn-dependent oxidoreductase
VVNHRATADWPAEVRRITGGRGVEHVVETGGVGTLEASLRAVAVGGEIAWVGMMAGGPAAIDARGVFNAAASLRGVAAGNRAQLQAMARAVAVHRLRPIIDRVFRFEEAPAAFAYYAAGRSFGKVVITAGGARQ